MAEKNNKAVLIGELLPEVEFDHEVFGENFYRMTIRTYRTSGAVDEIPIMVSDRLINPEIYSCDGVPVKVSGEFRSYNQYEPGKKKLILYVLAQEIQELKDVEEADCKRNNSVMLQGFVCKKPIYRETPLGREIADLLIAVNRPYGKSDYIPCIVWGRNARYVAGLEVGEEVQLHGRIQSRVYTKRLNEEACERRVAYEVSVSCIRMVD